MSRGPIVLVLSLAVTGTLCLGAAVSTTGVLRTALIAGGLVFLALAVWIGLRYRPKAEPRKAARISDSTQQGQPSQRAIVANGVAYVGFTNAQGHQNVHSYAGKAWTLLPSPTPPLTGPQFEVSEDASPVLHLWNQARLWHAPATGQSELLPVPLDLAPATLRTVEHAVSLRGRLFVLATTSQGCWIGWRGTTTNPVRAVATPSGSPARPMQVVASAYGVGVALVLTPQQGEQRLGFANENGLQLLHTAAAIPMVVATPAQVVFAAQEAGAANDLKLMRTQLVPEGGREPARPTAILADGPSLLLRHGDAVVAVVGGAGSRRVIEIAGNGTVRELQMQKAATIDTVFALTVAIDGVYALAKVSGRLTVLREDRDELRELATTAMPPVPPTEFVVAGTVIACGNGRSIWRVDGHVLVNGQLEDEGSKATLVNPRDLFALGGSIYFTATDSGRNSIYRLTD